MNFLNKVKTIDKGSGLVPLFEQTQATVIDDGDLDVTAAGTAEPLVATATPCRVVYIKAKSTNTGFCFIGGASVSALTGIGLDVGDVCPPIEIDDLSKIYVDVADSGDGVGFVFVA